MIQIRLRTKSVNFYLNLATSLHLKFPNPDKSFRYHLNYIVHYQRSMFMSPTDPEEVSRIITSLKLNNISGHGGVSSKLLKTL